MKFNRLGRTDISVSEICLGTMTWGSQNSETEAHAQMDHAIDGGINFFDTAELYPTTPVSAAVITTPSVASSKAGRTAPFR